MNDSFEKKKERFLKGIDDEDNKDNDYTKNSKRNSNCSRQNTISMQSSMTKKNPK